MKQWDKIFKEHGRYFTRIHEALPKIVKLFKKRNVRRVLDLGCGSGRHIVYLTKHGFSVYGIDGAKEGIKIAKDWLKGKGLKATLKVGSIYKKLPYRENLFDAIICVAVMYHARIRSIKKLIKEIERVLKPKGLIFLTAPKKKLKFKEIEPRTYLMLEGDEKGLVHYIYNKKLLRKDFKKFKIYKIWTDSWGYWTLLGELKG